jgi:hypothetical protein
LQPSKIRTPSDRLIFKGLQAILRLLQIAGIEVEPEQLSRRTQALENGLRVAAQTQRAVHIPAVGLDPKKFNYFL